MYNAYKPQYASTTAGAHLQGLYGGVILCSVELPVPQLFSYCLEALLQVPNVLYDASDHLPAKVAQGITTEILEDCSKLVFKSINIYAQASFRVGWMTAAMVDARRVKARQACSKFPYQCNTTTPFKPSPSQLPVIPSPEARIVGLAC